MSRTATLSRNLAPEHLHLAPPRQGRWLGPVALALVVHGLLVAALTWGVGWKQDAPPTVFEAELWSRLPEQAAPRAEEPPALPPPAKPQPNPKPTPTPKPVAKAEPRPTPPPPGPSQAQIATEQAKKKKAAEKAAELLQRELEKKEDARKKAVAEKRAAEKLQAENLQAAKLAAEQAALAEKKAADQRQALARKAADNKRQAQQRADREDQIRRMMGQAGASGGPTASGTAQQSSGPSPGYGGRVAARIKPNVVFTETTMGNPRTEVEVRTLPDGTITSRRIVKSSGNAEWDDAVLKAIDRTATLPRDTDGRVPSSLIIGLRPLD